MQDSDTTIPQATASQVDQIAALLMGEPEPPKKEPAPVSAEMPDDGAQATEAEKPEAVAPDAPEKDAVDYGMQVPITGGEPVTLGVLKDHYQNHQAAMLEVQDRENVILRKSQDIEQLMSFLDELPPAAVELAKARRQAVYAAEMPKLAAAIPGINTAEGAREVVKVMAEAAKDYGISEDELRMVMDSRYIKWMYDAARQTKAIREARNNVKPLRSDQPKAQHAAATSELSALTAKAKQTGKAQDVDQALAALLRSA
jgi:hypothetical protein